MSGIWLSLIANWQECRVEDIASSEKNALATGPFGSAISSKFFTGCGIPVIRGSNLSTDVGKRLIDSDIVFVNPEKAKEFIRSIARKGDLIFTCWGTINQIGFIDKNSKYDEYIVSNKQMKLTPDTRKANPEFLYYLFSTPNKQFEIISNGIGAAVPGFNLGQLKKIDLLLPPLEEQKAIASVLSSLDDKIDLLHRQNKTLETMAGALFRQWFVEEAKDNWEFVKLGNYVSCINGLSYKSDDLNPSSTAMVTLKSFDRGGGFRLDGFKEFTGKYKEQHVVTRGDLIVAHTDITQDAAVIGNPVLVIPDPTYNKLVISMDLVKITSNHEWLSNEFLYRLMRAREFKQHCLGFSNGSTVLHLSKVAIPSYEFLMPPKEKIEEFTKLVRELLGKEFANITQVRTLETLRDTLLPKLMNGEVRVDYP